MLQIVIVVAATVLVTACATLASRTPAERAADDQLAAQVEQALLNDQEIYARHIDVDAEHGVVHLSGLIWSVEELSKAKRVAARVPGVKRVVSELELEVGGGKGGR